MTSRGTIYTYSIIYSASQAFKDQTPFVIAVVEDEGSRILTRIEGYEKDRPISIGMEVELSRIDDNGYKLYKFI
ncbi:Zn-ribbon domain-containing OB-fold protein [Anaerosolibacter sp.]|uniref:Zn-ribbon domain-containing OB-fold protein n=1 Tax=Anaerosolibacter sp. TaxID=1872527 RepID=UPI0039EF8F6E